MGIRLSVADLATDGYDPDDDYHSSKKSRRRPSPNTTDTTSVGVLVSQRLAEREADARIAARDAEVERRLALVDAFGEDPHTDGTVIAFGKRFYETAPKAYTYVAVRLNGYWYLSGANRESAKALTWARLAEWLITDGEPTTFDMIQRVGCVDLPQSKVPINWIGEDIHHETGGADMRDDIQPV